MTATQISTCLSDIGGYSLDEMLVLNEVSSINLSTDSNLYPEENKTRFYFKTDNDCNLLLVYEVRVSSDGGLDVCDHPITFVSFDAITGFTLKSIYHTQSPYKFGKTV